MSFPLEIVLSQKNPKKLKGYFYNSRQEPIWMQNIFQNIVKVAVI